MSDPVAPNTPLPASGSGELSLSDAAKRIEGLLGGPAKADKPTPAPAAAEDPASEPEDAPEESEAATQPADDDAGVDEQSSSDEDAEAQTDPAQKAPIEVELSLPDGSTEKVKLDELKNGYLRHSDYTRKTQALAAEKQGFEAAVQQVTQTVKARLDTLQAEIDRLVVSEKSIDWETLRASDPAEFVRWKEYFRDLKDQGQRTFQERQAIAQQEAQRQAQQSAETLKREADLLVKAIPVFADPKKGDAAKAELRSYLLKQGYSDEQIQGLSDHRSVKIAWKAAQYDKLQAAKPQIDKRVVALPRVQKPGAALDGDHASRQKLTSLQGKLRQTGRVEDAAALILARMN